MEGLLRRTPSGFITSTIPTSAAPFLAATPGAQETQAKIQAMLASQGTTFQPTYSEIRVQESTVNGVVIGLLSSFGSALLILLVALVVWFFRYTSSGRILLDRIGRPGEFDDLQQYLREEEAALEEMDDIQRTEYFRAKGTKHGCFSSPRCC
jgi:hypothetical protein